MSETTGENAAIGIIGGSGLYNMDSLREVEEIAVSTPFGSPSDHLIKGTLNGRTVYFLPRHSRGHKLLPHELPHRANIYALRSLNVRYVISVTAVGSLREAMKPRDIVVPDQIFDHTSRRTEHTFFGDGIAAHVSMADPYAAGMRQILIEAAREVGGADVHDRGLYINMDGPAFSTRGESEIYRRWGCDVIGMTNAGEARLCREAEIAMATLAMVTDYDCWHEEEEDVSVEAVIENLMANAALAQKVVARAVSMVPEVADWPEHQVLDRAIITAGNHWTVEAKERLRPLMGRLLGDES